MCTCTLNSWNNIQQSLQIYQLHKTGDNYIAERCGQFMMLSQEQFCLLDTAKNNSDLEQARSCVNQYFDGVTKQEFIEITDTLLIQLEEVYKQPNRDYTYGNFTLLNLNILCDIAYYCRNAFQPWFFCGWSTLFLVSAFVFLFLNPSSFLYTEINASDILWAYLALLGVSVIHEFGHICAASLIEKKYIKTKFGFYLFIPIFYVDVSHIWKGNRTQRIIVAVAGYATQTIPTSLILLYAYIYDDSFWYYIGC